MSNRNVPRTFFYSLTFLLLSSYSNGQSCALVRSKLPVSSASTRLGLVEALSNSLHMSVIAELEYSSKEHPLIVGKQSTVDDVARLIGLNGNVQCSIEEQVVHIYDPAAVTSRANALNHVFESFLVPRLAQLFIPRWRWRVSTESFRPNDSAPVSGSDTGATSNDTERYALTPDLLDHESARSILLKEAAEVPMVFGIEIRVASTKSYEALWREAEKTMIFNVVSLLQDDPGRTGGSSKLFLPQRSPQPVLLEQSPHR